MTVPSVLASLASLASLKNPIGYFRPAAPRYPGRRPARARNRRGPPRARPPTRSTSGAARGGGHQLARVPENFKRNSMNGSPVDTHTPSNHTGPMKNCTVCGKTFTPKRSASVCSRRCHNRARRQKWRENMRARVKAGRTEPKPCGTCDQMFQRHRIAQAYCSKKCQPKHVRGGKRFPRWTTDCGEVFKPGTAHQHHITPRSQGGEDAPKNLVLLCPRCHVEVHRSALFRYVGPPDREGFLAACQNFPQLMRLLR
jgi:5-methylcytosine-specific restriction endonuclease McrA